jgi:hypothetical protein
MTFNRTYGVEIEAIAPSTLSRDAVAARLTAAGIPAYAPAYLDHNTPSQWKVTTDSSLASSTGYEIVSPPLGADGFEQIDKVCGALAAMGFTVNKNCGLHVHVDVRRPAPLSLEALKRLAILYVEHEALIDMVLPPSRRANAGRFCASIANVSVAAINRCEDTLQIARVLKHEQRIGSRRRLSYSRMHAEYHLRYVKLNYIGITGRGTVEFRHHSGTVEADKIKNWVLACQRMVELASKEEVAEQTVREATRVIRAVRAGTKREIVCQMLMRPEGCTRQEVLAATGWREISVDNIASQHGIQLRKQKEFGTTRYWGVTGDAATAAERTVRQVAQVTRATTFAEFADKLGMAENEKAYWAARAASIAERIARAQRLGSPAE